MSTPDLPVVNRIETERLLLRPWRPEDRAPYAAINADPEVMEFIDGGPVEREVSDASADGIERAWADHGYGLYAVELRSTGEFVGYIGLHRHPALLPDIEIGWRLARSTWGMGLATEGARAVRDVAFETLGLPALVSATVVPNLRSARVMEKLGMRLWKREPNVLIYRIESPSL